jgi:hypothetical protein
MSALFRDGVNERPKIASTGNLQRSNLPMFELQRAPSKTLKLQLCSHCKSVFICSHAYMKAAWKKGQTQVYTDMGLDAGECSEVATVHDSQKGK